jgi:hypothetical protein
MKLRVLAGALALSLGATALAPAVAEANDRDRGWRDRRRGGRVAVTRSYRHDRPRAYRSSRSYRSYRSYGYVRPYGYSTYGYRSYGYSRPYRYYDDYYYDDYYGGYYDSYRYRPRVVVLPSYRYRAYRGYRPSLGVRVGGPHFGVWLGF